MERTVISIEHVWKQYRLGMVGTGSLNNDLKRMWYRLRGKEDPFLKLGETNDRTKRGDSEYVWALEDISFQVKEGEVMGIVGRNGAGKSTLLKILSRVTAPTRGEMKVRGRIASLLEVGTGFHPDLSGRENIFLNGTILGMKRSEIKANFDEIVAFSGVERYIDTPVKRYSSGMYVRLAFAVAAHLKPEILIVDEVLAVGDVEFQKKCLGKMKDVSEQGRTVIFVSHNMTAIKTLCTRGILMEQGKVALVSNTNDVVNAYLRSNTESVSGEGEVIWEDGTGPGCEEIRLKSLRLLDEKNEVASTFLTTNSVLIEITYQVFSEIVGSRMVMQLIDANGTIVFSSTNHLTDTEKKTPGTYITTCRIPENLLNRGNYNVLIHSGIPGVKVLINGKPFVRFNTVLMGNQGSMFTENWTGVVAPMLKWETQKQTV